MIRQKHRRRARPHERLDDLLVCLRGLRTIARLAALASLLNLVASFIAIWLAGPWYLAICFIFVSIGVVVVGLGALLLSMCVSHVFSEHSSLREKQMRLDELQARDRPIQNWRGN